MARRFTSRPRGSSRGHVWLGQSLPAAVIPANNAVLLSVLNAAGLALRPFTVIRTHLDVLWSSDQAAAAEDPFGAFGAMVVTDSASAIGITALPDPIGNTNSDWFVYQGMSVLFSFGTAVGIDGNAGAHYAIDSKAMRKVGDDDDIVLVASNNNAADGGVITIHGRMLVKLH